MRTLTRYCGKYAVIAAAMLACDEAAQQEQEQLGQARGPVELQLSIGGLLRLFMERRERRVAIYRRFEEGFTSFCRLPRPQDTRRWLQA